MAWTFPNDPIDISSVISYWAGWDDIDISTFVPVGTKAVLLRCHCTGTVERVLGVRPTGNTEDLKGDINPATGEGEVFRHTILGVRADSNRKFDGYFETAAIVVKIIGYSDEDTFFQNSVAKGSSTLGDWEDIDCSAAGVYGPVVLGHLNNEDNDSRKLDLRQKGSSQELYVDLDAEQYLGVLFGVDGSKRAQQKIEDADEDLWLWGYFSAGAELASWVDVAPSTRGSWQDVDVSAYVPVGTKAVFVRLYNGTGVDSRMAIRKNGSTEDINLGLTSNKHIWMVVGVDSNRKFQAYLPYTGTYQVVLLGYIMDGVGTAGYHMII